MNGEHFRNHEVPVRCRRKPSGTITCSSLLKVNGEEAAVHEIPEIDVEKLSGMHNKVPAFEGGVNGEEAAVHDVPAF